VDQSLDRLSKSTSVNAQSEIVMRELLQVYISCRVSDLEMLSFPSEMVGAYNSEIIPIRPRPPVPYLYCNSSRSMETLANVHLHSVPINRRNTDLVFISKEILISDPKTFSPKVGVPIHIPVCEKGHGCRHACQTVSRFGYDSCYVETKYDGQRMQIHIDLTLPMDQQIKIFSKNRKDSTKDRWEIIS
jgi:hypothetical protein